MAQISLSGSDKVALVDDEDVSRILQVSKRWYYHRKRGYAFTPYTSHADGKKYSVDMHRVVAGTPRGMATDHLNNDKLDNRKCNLKICSQRENIVRSVKRRVHYVGVRKQRGCDAYVSTIMEAVSGKIKYLGSYSDKQDAARAYNIAYREQTGTQHPVNDIDEPFKTPSSRWAPLLFGKNTYYNKQSKSYSVQFCVDGANHKPARFGYYRSIVDATTVAEYVRDCIKSSIAIDSRFVKETKDKFAHLRGRVGNPNFRKMKTLY